MRASRSGCPGGHPAIIVTFFNSRPTFIPELLAVAFHKAKFIVPYELNIFEEMLDLMHNVNSTTIDHLSKHER